MNTAIMFLLALARTYGHGVLRCAVPAGVAIAATDRGAVAVTFESPRLISGNLVGRCKGCKRGKCIPDAVRAFATIEVPGESGKRSAWVALTSTEVLHEGMSGGYVAACACGGRVAVRAVVGHGDGPRVQRQVHGIDGPRLRVCVRRKEPRPGVCVSDRVSPGTTGSG